MGSIKRCLSHIVFFSILFLTGCKDNGDDVNPAAKTVTSNDFLSEGIYPSLIIEITYVEGFAPSSASVDNLKSFLQARLNKSGGITVIQKSIHPPGNSSYSLSDLQSVEDTNRTVR